MDLKIDIETLTKALGGKLLKGNPGAPFSRFETDSRKVKNGDFFLPLKGVNYDAHSFLPSTLAAGAGGWIAEALKIPDKTPETVITVDNTLKALQALALFHRRRFNPRLAAITGSNGKSTVKEMLTAVFSAAGPTCSNRGNLNNHIGLPLSLLELSAEHRYAVFELGASKQGDTAEIAALALPDVGVVTNIAPAHLEGFGDMETLFRTETEVADHLAADGVMIYNADDDWLSRLAGRPRSLSFGRSQKADFRVQESGSGFSICEKEGQFQITLSQDSAHNRLNAAAAWAAARTLGVPPEHIISGLAGFHPPPMRMQEIKIKEALVILDAYNANPHSMASALKEMTGKPKPLYLMLGDMKELGKFSKYYHTDLGAALAHMGAEKVFLAGPEMKAAAGAYCRAGGNSMEYGESLEDWLPQARELISAGKGSFLIKASRSMKFERIIEGL